MTAAMVAKLIEKPNVMNAAKKLSYAQNQKKYPLQRAQTIATRLQTLKPTLCSVSISNDL
jgi:ethanolamine ammonia-lyase large subunit